MNNFKKELIKFFSLVALGFTFLVVGFIGLAMNNNSFKLAYITFNDILVFICFVLYPVGIVYGWSFMLSGLRNSLKSRHEAANIILLALTVVFAWIPGVFIAFNRLRTARQLDDGLQYSKEDF